jgi:hypothetical protein
MKALVYLWIGLLSLAFQPVVAQAQAWQAGGCPQALEPEIQAYEQSVRSAAPGSTVYVPKPFPTTASDVMIDAHYAYLRIYRDPAVLPKFERQFYSRLTAGQYAYRVDQVANWTPGRCRNGDRKLSYFLVTLRDLGSGRPIGRMALNPAGLLMEWAPNPGSDLPPLSDYVGRVTAQFKLTPVKAQFATVWGDLECISPLDPCLVFEANSNNYILATSGLYVFQAGTQLAAADAAAIKNFAGYQSAKAKLAPDEALVSLTTEGWAVARKVQPPS